MGVEGTAECLDRIVETAGQMGLRHEDYGRDSAGGALSLGLT